MGDSQGLIETIRRVCREGRDNGYYWRERYNEKGGYGAEKYCEYPANLIRVIQRFLLGVDHGPDGTLFIGPTVPDQFWNGGFGQVLSWQDRKISYKMKGDQIIGEYSGENGQKLSVRLKSGLNDKIIHVTIDGQPATSDSRDGWVSIVLPAASKSTPCKFEIAQR